MSTKYIMIDTETSGIKKEQGEVLEIGMLECNLGRDGYFYGARDFHKILHFDDPELSDPWILKTHAELLLKCKEVEYQSPTEVRAEILAFFRRCCGDNPVYVMGLNLVNFDLPWLRHHKYLHEDDTHYRTYELSGAYNMAQTALFLDRNTFFKQANEAAKTTIMPKGQAHTALFDCHQQLKTLNGALKLLRK